MYYVYILANRTRTMVYTGVTNDLVRRMWEHRNDVIKNSFTAKYKIHDLVYYEAGNDAYGAITREKQIKSWNRSRKNKLVETMNPKWEDLYQSILG